MHPPMAFDTSNDTQRVDTRDTSRAALDALSPKKLAAKTAEIMEVVKRLHQTGEHDASLSEIQRAFEHWNERRIDLNRVSARVYDLVQAQQLERIKETRPCKVTGRLIHAVRVIPKQSRLQGV